MFGATFTTGPELPRGGHCMSHTSEDYCRSCRDTVHLVQGKWKIHILVFHSFRTGSD